MELARAQGVALVATTRFEELESAVQYTDPPLVGSLEGAELDALVELLRPLTRTPQSCWFGVWEGYGWMKGPPAIRKLIAPGVRRSLEAPPAEQGALPWPAPPCPRIDIADRSLALYCGPLEAAGAFCRPPTLQSPNLWWPEDRAWCVASEVDFRSTYVGGGHRLIDRLLQDARLEAIRVWPSDRATD